MANEPGRMQQRRGASADMRAETLRSGELGLTTDSGHLGRHVVMGDGVTAGGQDPDRDGFSVGWPSGHWITNTSSLLGPTPATTTANLIIYVPICIPPGAQRGFQNIGTNVTGAGGGGEGVRLGLYSNVSGRPSARIFDSGALSVSSTGFKSVFGSFSQPLRPGWYWTAFITDSATATFDSLTTTGYLAVIPWVSTTYKRPTVAYEVQAYGALPSTATPAGVINGSYPLVHLQGV